MDPAVRSDPRTPPVPTSLRVVRDSTGWFQDGAARKQLARRLGRCVECLAPLPPRRREYCSRACQWRFHGRFFWDAARTVVMRRDHYTCRQCGRRGRKRELEVDHVLEVARGGPSLDYDNLQTLCRTCHREKTVRFLRTRRRSAGPAPRSLATPSAVRADEFDWFPA